MMMNGWSWSWSWSWVLGMTGCKRKKIMEKKDLPCEIMESILSGLPVKSLLRFKCVCKEWYNIISSPQFAKIHLHHPQTQARTRLCILDYQEKEENDYTVGGCVLSTSEYDDNGNLVVLDNLHNDEVGSKILKLTYEDGCILDSCDGLLCLFNELDKIVLWNPCTRQYNQLPQNPNASILSNSDNDYEYGPCYYGFGYDSCSDDYKIVVVFPCVGYKFSTRIEVFSLKSNYWRSSVVEDYIAPLAYEMGVVLHGASHWIAVEDDDEDQPMILGFDFEKEQFTRKMTVPIKNLYGAKLKVIERCRLCVYNCDDEDKHPSEKWVMNEYGVDASWTKMAYGSSWNNNYFDFNETVEGERGHFYYYRLCQLTGFLNDQHLLLINDGDKNEKQMVLWDHKENIENLVMTCEKWCYCQTNFFVDTLVSPYSTTTLNN